MDINSLYFPFSPFYPHVYALISDEWQKNIHCNPFVHPKSIHLSLICDLWHSYHHLYFLFLVFFLYHWLINLTSSMIKLVNHYFNPSFYQLIYWPPSLSVLYDTPLVYLCSKLNLTKCKERSSTGPCFLVCVCLHIIDFIILLFSLNLMHCLEN